MIGSCISKCMSRVCLCGCGEPPTGSFDWKRGHREIWLAKQPKRTRSEAQSARWARDKVVPVLNLCKCGQCDQMVKGDYARGHYARVHNPSSDPEVRAKRRISAKRRIDEGERTFAGWNKGLTKETDERVAAYGQKHSEEYWTEERCSEQSERLIRQWEEGRIHVNRGADCWQWKGGVSALQPWARAALYQAWSRPIMVRDKFKCQMCDAGSSGKLCVHHDQERFAPIMHRIVAGRIVSDLTPDEKVQIVEEIVRYHLENDVHGVTLCRVCHDKVHQVDPDLD